MSDLINRQVVLDTIDSYMSHHMGLLDLKLFVTELPPVNPRTCDVPIMCDVLEYLENIYTGARACDDVAEQVRLARAIEAYKQDVHEDCCFLDNNKLLEIIKAEVKRKIEEDEFARSVYRREEKDKGSADMCTGSIMAYRKVLKILDRCVREEQK